MRFTALNRANFWPLAFFTLVFCYGIFYAPYGINETDGGFLTGLAWQVLQGKTLYQDIVYVRPPLPVWLRALEMQILPHQWAILGERWIFYGKVAAYSWLAAAVLSEGRDRWRLAVFGFVVSAHCYPATAWHTVDGILFAVVSAYGLFRMPGRGGVLLAGVALFAALLCKQSFYPLAVFGLIAAYFAKPRRFLKPTRFKWLGWSAGFLLSTTLFFSYLYQNNLLTSFLRLTNGAANSGQAIQHGVLDYFRIATPLAVLSVVLLLLCVVFWQKKRFLFVYPIWMTWLAALIGSYAFSIWQRQDFTVPFAQSRLLFWLAVGWICFKIVHSRRIGTGCSSFIVPYNALFLLAISWCAAVSWGYNLPILFATPGVWAALEISRRLHHATFRSTPQPLNPSTPQPLNLLALLALLAVFRYGYEFVYRDGRRSAMTEDLGRVFPALQGIRSNAETVALYEELKMLHARYGPNVKTLPSFPQANFLTNTMPPLPLDWVVAREMNADSALVMKVLQIEKPILLIEKQYLTTLETDPELALVRSIVHTATRLEETPHFWVMQ